MKYYFFRTLQWVANRLSWRNAYRFAYLYACLWYIVDTSRKNQIRTNLEIVDQYQNKSTPPSEQNKRVFKTMVNFSKYLMEIFRLPSITTDYLHAVKYENSHHLVKNENLTTQPCIIFTLHYGNWELAGIKLCADHYPLTSVALPHPDPREEALFNSWRNQFGLDIIPLDEKAGHRCLKAIKQGRLLALLGDEDYSGSGINVQWLGHSFQIPAGAAALSRASGVPLLPGVFQRQPDNSFKMIFTEPVYPIRTGQSEQDLKNITEQCLKSLEPFILEDPTQWFHFG